MADKRLQLYRANAFFCGWGGAFYELYKLGAKYELMARC